jgi:hypothetical protein
MRALAILAGTAASFATMLGAGGQALADTIVYSTGFEAPAYHTGALAGQDGWSGSGGVVENTLAYAGTQAVESNAIGVVKTQGAVGDLTMLSVSSDGPMMQVSDEFYATAADPNVAWEVLAIGGNGTNNSGLVGQLFVADGYAILGGSTNGGLVPISIDAWNSYTIDINFTTGTETGYVNNTLIDTLTIASNSTEVTEVGFGIDGANGASSQAYFDNLSVDTVPEPATLMLFAPGLLALAACRQRRRQRRVPLPATTLPC